MKTSVESLIYCVAVISEILSAVSDREPSQQWCEQIELSTCEGVSRCEEHHPSPKVVIVVAVAVSLVAFIFFFPTSALLFSTSGF